MKLLISRCLNERSECTIRCQVFKVSETPLFELESCMTIPRENALNVLF